MDDVFTTGEIAKLCRVAVRTVTGWIDKGLLKGYRLPGSFDRRVTREELVRFLRHHGMPLFGLEPEPAETLPGHAAELGESGA